MQSAKNVGAYQGTGGKVIQFGNRVKETQHTIVGVTEGVYPSLNLEIDQGRDFISRQIDIQTMYVFWVRCCR